MSIIIPRRIIAEIAKISGMIKEFRLTCTYLYKVLKPAFIARYRKYILVNRLLFRANANDGVLSYLNRQGYFYARGESPSDKLYNKVGAAPYINYDIPDDLFCRCLVAAAKYDLGFVFYNICNIPSDIVKMKLTKMIFNFGLYKRDAIKHFIFATDAYSAVYHASSANYIRNNIDKFTVTNQRVFRCQLRAFGDYLSGRLCHDLLIKICNTRRKTVTKHMIARFEHESTCKFAGYRNIYDIFRRFVHAAVSVKGVELLSVILEWFEPMVFRNDLVAKQKIRDGLEYGLAEAWRKKYFNKINTFLAHFVELRKSGIFSFQMLYTFVPHYDNDHDAYEISKFAAACNKYGVLEKVRKLTSVMNNHYIGCIVDTAAKYIGVGEDLPAAYTNLKRKYAELEARFNKRRRCDK